LINGVIKKSYSNVPFDLTNKFDPVYIKSKWYPNASFARNARLPTVIKPSSEWDDDHLYAFNLHYLRVEKEEDWKVYICPPANLTHDAIALSSYKHGPNAFKAGEHEMPPYDQDPYFLRRFGNIIGEYYARLGSEAVIDKLAELLLEVCNCDRGLLQSVSKLAMDTRVGQATYASIPDHALIPRFALADVSRYTLVVVEDKFRPHYVEPQLGGEMVAAAIHNYKNFSTATTMFGMVLKGTDVSFYRTDFPEAYLKSVIDGKPAGDVVMFKYSGSSQQGIDVTFCSTQRTLALQVLCSIISFCAKEMVPYINARPGVLSSPHTLARLELLRGLNDGENNKGR
jgi:hypothetical protein